MPLLAIVLAVGFSAFTQKESASDNTLQTLSWVVTNPDGSIPSNPQYLEGTAEEIRAELDCPDEFANYCAREVDPVTHAVKPAGMDLKKP